MEGFDRLAQQLRKNAMAEVEKKINEQLPAGLTIHARNPADSDEEDEAEAVEAEAGDESDEGDEDDIGSLVWEDADPDHNWACAVAAWRVASQEGDIVAKHKRGMAFYGQEADLLEYVQTHDLAAEDWQVLDDPAEIMAEPYDVDAMREVLKMLDTTEYESAKDVYEKFHWGDDSNLTVVKNITGVTAPLVHLGVGRRIEYGAKKDGEFAEYYHEFGEDSGSFPQVYAILDPAEKHPVALLIHGGEMRIEPRGIVE